MPNSSIAPNSAPPTGIRGSFIDFVDDPFIQDEQASIRWIPDGLLVIQDGYIKAFGNYSQIAPAYDNLAIQTHDDRIIMPGLIDTHIHYPQTGMIAAYGEQLLEWLSRYTFPTEQKFKDKTYALEIAELFLDELLKNGTTTALIYAAVFPESVDAIFEAAQRRNLRLIAGKVMMDRNAPKDLCDTAETSYQESKALIQKWHQKGRLLYAVTPRFAGTSSRSQLDMAGKLLREFPGVYLQTHLSENRDEVAWIRELFPDSQDYLDVYDRSGLVQSRSVFAHGIHLSEREFQRLSEAESAIAFCPTSNLFLGSGLFNLARAKSADSPVKVGLGTDVGAGTSFSLLQTTNEAYKVAQLQGQKLSPLQAMFLATLGGARALSLEDKIGNFDVGKEADFIVLDDQATPLMALRNGSHDHQTLEALCDRIFSLVIMGDDRAIAATYIMGQPAHTR
ncbi:guanine deaminase [filamentous cyanobacterium CCP5]|nr:guanine deaminase [filamentous cyanobacterium CCT1]PSN17712.1 guanine deaminase [filamentous cyanobacterium CCP5]